MAVEIETVTPTKVSLTIEVEAQRVQAEREKVFHDMARHVHIRGFRKGKAPRKMMEKYINPETLNKEVLDRLVPAAFGEALKSSQITPVTRPQYEVLHFADNEPLKFKAVFERRPDIPLNDYKGIPVEVKRREMGSDDVEKTLQSLLEARAVYEGWPDGLVTEGEGAILDLQGFVDGKAFEGGSFQGILLETKKDWVVPGFMEQIFGMKAGEEREVRVTLPHTFEPAIAGKQALFKVRVHEVKQKKLPPLDDALAQSLGEYKDLNELKGAIEKNIAAYLLDQEKLEGFDKAMNHLTETIDFPVPDLFIEDRMKQFERDTLHMLEDGHKPFPEFLREKYPEVFALAGVSDEDKTKRAVARFREELHPKAMRMARVDLILDEVWRREKLRVTQDEVNQEVNRLSARYHMSPEDIAKALRDEHTFQAFIAGILRAKASLVIRDNLKISYAASRQDAPENKA